MIGATISHYKITAKLGEGGMGVVYKAEDTRLKRVVALKFLATSALGDEDQKARFLREAQSAALLDHPNIATVHDIGEQDGHTFMAIAFVDGPELAAKIRERPLKLEEALDIAIQICEGLKEAHEKGVTHRDIKPSNIMLTKKGRVKITDFGLAHLAGRSKLTKSGTSLGTPAYMSPEQALGDPTDRRSDIWGVGVVLYEMIAGKIPFAHEHEQAIIYSIINEPPEPLTAVRTGLPTELDRVMGKALAKKPEERYQHIDDFLVDLRRLRKQLTSKAPEVSSTQAAAAKPQAMPETEGRPALGPGRKDEAPRHPLAKYRVIEDSEEQDDTVSYVAEDTEQHRSVSIRVVPQSSAQRIEYLQRRRRVVPLIVAALALASTLVVTFLWLSSPTQVAGTRLLKSALPVTELVDVPQISPNGRHIAYLTGEDGTRILWVQDLDQDEPRPIFGPEGNLRGVAPSWSADSQFLSFYTDSELKKVSVSGGGPITLCEVGAFTSTAAWSPDGKSIIFTHGRHLSRVPAGGGEPEPWLEPQQEGYWAVEPAFFSSETGIDKLLYTELNVAGDADIVALDRTTGKREILMKGRSPTYAASGHVLYRAASVGVWATPFSSKAMKASGNPFPVSEDGRHPSVSWDGTLVYLAVGSSTSRKQLVWRDRAGNVLGTIGQPQDAISYPELSPDEKLVAAYGKEGGRANIWIHEVDRSVKTRLTSQEVNLRPIWSPSGDQIAFASGRTGLRDLYVKLADGSGNASPLLLTSEQQEWPSDWSRDGSVLLFRRDDDVLYLNRKPDGSYEETPFLMAPFRESDAQLSPDERFVAYVSDELGQREVFMQAFPQGGSKQRVSVNGGHAPRWRADGRELFFVEGVTLMAAPVSPQRMRTAGSPEPLFSATSLGWGPDRQLAYDVTPDGKRFVVVDPTDGETEKPSTIRITQNWYEEFRGREQ